MGNFCQIQWQLGQVDYQLALQLQKELATRRAAGEIPNTLLLLEHAHTFTIGIDGHRDHLLIDNEELARLNIACYQVDRGGSVYYHGPGQLTCYPILNLSEYGYSYHQYIARLESVIIQALSFFKVHAFRQPGQRGIWVLPGNALPNTPKWVETDQHIAKIATIGVKVNNRQITSYGFSINVDPDLGYYDLIIPRGIEGCYITSLRHALNKPVEIGAVIEPVIQSFCQLFELEPLAISPLSFTNRATITRLRNSIKQETTERSKGLEW